MRHVGTHREAAAETIAAALYYDRQVPGLGADFLLHDDSSVAAIRARLCITSQIDGQQLGFVFGK